MAMGFFRRHQKLVIGIMIVAMLGFGVFYYALDLIGKSMRGSGPPLGTAFGEDVTYEDHGEAKQAVQLLRMPPVQLGRMGSLPDDAFRVMLEQSPDPALAFELLSREADEAGVTCVDSEVTRFLEARGVSGDVYSNFVAEARDTFGMKEAEARQAVGEWIAVAKFFRGSLASSMPSDAILRRVHRDQMERVRLRIVQFSAEDYLTKVSEPNDAQVRAHFQQYRNQFPRRYDSPQSFGFGYRQQTRVLINYLLLRRGVLEQAVVPTEDEVAEEYVPSDDPNVAAQRLEEAYATAQNKAVVLLMDSMARSVSDLLDDYENRQDRPSAGAYTWVRRETEVAGTEMLARRVSLEAKDLPLPEMIRLLSRKADLKGIAYPLGKAAGVEIDPNQTITLDVEGLPLGQVLAQIDRQVFGEQGTRLGWMGCSLAPNMLFPTAGVDLFPLQVGRPDAMSLPDLASHDVLGAAATRQEGGQRLVETVISVLRQRQENPDQVELEQPVMLVFDSQTGKKKGRVYWQLKDVLPEGSPEWPPNAALLKKIRADLRTKLAFEMALADAAKVKTSGQLDAVADARGLESGKTELFSRQALRYPGFILMIPLDLTTGEGEDERIFRPGVQAFGQAAFSLIPVEGESDQDRLTVLPLPATGTVAVLELIDYDKASKAALERPERRMRLVQELSNQQLRMQMGYWFGPRQIFERVAYRQVADIGG